MRLVDHSQLPPMARYVAGLPLTEIERSLCKAEVPRGLPADWEHVRLALVEAGYDPPVPASLTGDPDPFNDLRVTFDELTGLSVVDQDDLGKLRFRIQRYPISRRRRFSWERTFRMRRES
jgi:hypothetical protein